MRKKSKIDLLVDKSARVLVLGAAAEFVLQFVGFAAIMKDSFKTIEKLTTG